ncbi:putative Intraflagellar transport protein 22 [Blattamonas nauphoetae]|uniref:Intraflagellar transport protein 22 n=1 Tax=Blattamonas nauphoetae TaxID=2049346 RepID=A0ABQ9YKN6_9EUKA|nr:putative Intraflagellar transport protein 22 [Blattamonas nauphoetae]
MSTKLNVKILVLGPKNVGKTNISNLIAGTIEKPSERYEPTVGLRILEVFTTPATKIKNVGDKLLVELWDVSGDRRYEETWPAIWKDADGILFVFDADDKSQPKEMEIWYRSFAMPAELSAKHCRVFAHHKQPHVASSNPIKLGSAFQGINVVHTSLDNEVDLIRGEFDSLAQAAIEHASIRLEKSKSKK